MPQTIPAAKQTALRAEARAVIGRSVVPAHKKLLAFLREAAETAVPLTLRLPDSGDAYEVTSMLRAGEEWREHGPAAGGGPPAPDAVELPGGALRVAVVGLVVGLTQVRPGQHRQGGAHEDAHHPRVERAVRPRGDGVDVGRRRRLPRRGRRHGRRQAGHRWRC